MRSEQKYTDPTAVLKCLVDSSGNPVEIGEERDADEFNRNFLARINEGIYSEEIKKMKLELELQKK